MPATAGPRRVVRAPVLTLLVLLALAAAGGAMAAPAHAIDKAICTGTTGITYAPGVTNTPQLVTVSSVNLYTCISLVDPAIRSGSSSVVGSGVRTCTDLLGSGQIQLVHRWNTGETTTAVANYNVNYVGGEFVFTSLGIATDGKFRGSTIVNNSTAVGDPTDCTTTTGITRLFGPSQFIVAL